MKYYEVVRSHRTPHLKRAMVLFFGMVFFVGALIGIVIGRLSVSDKPSIENSSSQIAVEPRLDSLDNSMSIPRHAIDSESPTIYYDVPLSNDLQDYIRSLCEEKAVPMSLIIAMIEVESSFRTDVVSDTYDYGLMQINKINHEWLTDEYGITDFLDPHQNVFCGITIIAKHLEKTGNDTTLALMRYNCGATGAKRLWDRGIYSTSYTDKVIKSMEAYNEIQSSYR